MASIKRERIIPYLNAYREIIEKQTSFETEKSFRNIDEEYKRAVAVNAFSALNCDSWNESEIGEGRIGECAIKAVNKNQNLIGRFQVSLFSDKVREDLYKSERLLFDLYHDKKEQDSFEKLCDYFGRRYDLIAYLYFIIDPDRYLPLRPTIFDDIFRKLEIELETSGQCSWENYQSFISTVSEIRDLMREYYKKEDIDLLESHSFLWSFNPNGVLAEQEHENDESVAIGSKVNHRVYGEGTITNIKSTNIYVVFDVGLRIFPYPDAINKEYLIKA